MKLSEDAEAAVQMLFDESGRLDEAFVVNGWPYSAMAENELDRLKTGLMELESCGMVVSEPFISGGIYQERKVLKNSAEQEPAWHGLHLHPVQ